MYTLVNLVDPYAKPAKVLVKIRGTGHPCDNLENTQFMDTVGLGSLMFHVFVGNILE